MEGSKGCDIDLINSRRRLLVHECIEGAVTKLSRQRMLEAKTLARSLAKSFPSIEAVCLYGSVARGDASLWSDIDLLVIGKDLRPSRLRRAASLQKVLARTTFLCYCRETFESRAAKGSSFLIHIKREGIILYDRTRILKAFILTDFVPKLDIGGEIGLQLGRLQPYFVSSRYRGNFLFPLAHIFTIAKAIAMLGLAKFGVFEFNRGRALAQFAEFYPSVKEDVARVQALRPFYSLVAKRKPEPLPFPYSNCEREFERSVRAVHKMASLV